MSQDFYRIRDFVPDFDKIAQEFTERSRALTAKQKVLKDIRYGLRNREVLDIILPDRPARGAPIHVFIHGGYWRSGEKENYRFLAAPVLAVGGITAIVEYDLMPDQRLDVLIDQVRRSVYWIEKNAGEFGADPRRITVSGHSAGAHLASYLTAIGTAESTAPILPTIKGLLLVSGIYNLSGIPECFLRDEAKMNVTEAANWTPLSSKQLPCPQRIIAFGTAETPPFQEQAAAIKAQLSAEKKFATLLPVPDVNHMSVVLDMANPTGHLGSRLADLVAFN